MGKRKQLELFDEWVKSVTINGVPLTKEDDRYWLIKGAYLAGWHTHEQNGGAK